MSDIFREVDEDIRHEKYRRLWERFGPWVIVVAVLIVVGTGGYRGWLYWQESQAQKAGDTFMEAVDLSNSGKYDEAQALLDELAGATGGYPELSRMRSAALLAQNGKPQEALDAFTAISQDAAVREDIRTIATLRAAYIAMDSEDYTAVAARVEKLAGAGLPFRGAAREILAVSAWKSGDIENARKWIKELTDDAETPADVSRRIGLLSDVIRARYGEPAAAEEGSAQ